MFLLIFCSSAGTVAASCDDGVEGTCECVEAPQGFYAAALCGMNWLDTKDHVKWKGNILGGAAIGYKAPSTAFPFSIRVEAEASYRISKAGKKEFYDFTIFSSSAKAWALMGNFIYDIDLDFCLKPYLGIGVGCIWSHCEISGEDDYADFGYIPHMPIQFKGTHKQSEWVEQAIIGFNYLIWKNTELGLDYRFMSMKSNTHYNNVVVSLRRFF